MRAISIPLISLLAAIALSAPAQEPSGTWAVAKPILEKWDAEYQAAGRTIAARDRMITEIQKLLADHPSDIWAYEACALGYNRLNRPAEALQVMHAYLLRFPDDASLEERVLFFFGTWGTVQDLESLPLRWRTRLDYWQYLLRAGARDGSSPERLEHAGREVLARIPAEKDPGGNERFSIAESWMAHGVSPRSAEQVAREAVAISEVGRRPDDLYSSDQQRRLQNRLLLRNINRSALGWSLYQQKRYPEALAELQRAATIVEQDALPQRGVYYRLGQTLEALNRPEAAIQAYYKELAWGDLEKPTRAALAEAYRKVHHSTDGLETEARTHVNDLAIAHAERDSDLVREVDEELGRFDLLDEKGVPLDLKPYRGKFVIVDFWATWCGICRKTMQHTADLQSRFPGRIAVIAPSWDPGETRAAAADFLRQRNYHFALVFDDPARRAIQLPFIPARLLLDPRGRLRFLEFGYTPESAHLFQTKLESLLAAP